MKRGKPLVWILDDEWTDHQLEEEVLNGNGFTVKVTNSKTLERDLPLFAPYADGVIAQVGFSCGETIINQLHSCKVIGIYGAGFNHVDLPSAREKGIPVCNIPDYCVEEVSDHTVALMLSVSRRLQSYSQQVRAGQWDPLDTQPIRRIKDMTVGLFGFGRIARLVATKMKGFGVRLIAHDQYTHESIFKEHGVAPVSLEELMEQSNLLSLHVPLTTETENSINYDRMKMMPKGAFIVNTCRGGVINEDDLKLLIESGHIGGAGLDVLKAEPPGADHPLLHVPEVIITPHSSYISEESVTELKRRTCQIIINGVNGLPLSNELTQPIVQTSREIIKDQ